MARLRVLSFALAVSSAVPGAAEPAAADANAQMLTGRFGGDTPFQVQRRGFSFPVVDYVEPSGERIQRRGIIAGKTIAPHTLLGVGFFETSSKSRQRMVDPALNSSHKRSRKSAALGLTVRF